MQTPTIRLSSTSLAALLVALAAPALGAPPANVPDARTRDEIEKLIEEAGKTQPDWWDKTPLNFPSTLDLTWKPSTSGWQPQKNMGAYLWDIIDPNPAKWKEGAKLVHHTMTINKGDAAAIQHATNTLGKIYTELLCDYPRGAYWCRKAGNMDVALATCYLKLGSPSMAIELLKKIGPDRTRNAQVVKLWADLGDIKTALALAEAAAKSGNACAAYLAAGDACRRAGKTPEATAYYKKVLAQPEGKNEPRDNPVNKKRAQASLDAVKLFDALDLTKIADGTYKDSSIGYVGPVEVIVTVKNHKVQNVAIGQHHEKQYYASLTEVPADIIAKQSVKGIDTTTGATVTSEAIINATAKALAAAQK